MAKVFFKSAQVVTAYNFITLNYFYYAIALSWAMVLSFIFVDEVRG